MEILTLSVKTILALLAIAAGTERGSQLLKTLWNLFTSKWSWLKVQDERSFVLVTVVALSLSFYFRIDVTSFLQLFQGYDPNLVSLVNGLLIVFLGNKLHDNFFGKN